MKIELLYLMDCKYCLKTKETIRQAVEELNISVDIHEILIDSEDKAQQHDFNGSPTVRVNGKDLQDLVSMQVCDACSEMAGQCVSCRTFVYEGKTYTYPPKEMIKEAILKCTTKNS